MGVLCSVTTQNNRVVPNSLLDEIDSIEVMANLIGYDLWTSGQCEEKRVYFNRDGNTGFYLVVTDDFVYIDTESYDTHGMISDLYREKASKDDGYIDSLSISLDIVKKIL